MKLSTILGIVGVIIGFVTIVITVDWVRWILFKPLYLSNEKFCIVDADCQEVCGCNNFLSCRESTNFTGNVSVECKCLTFKCYEIVR